MSNQITEARIQGFKRGIDILSQQKGSKLQTAVRMEMQASKQDHYDQISATTAVERTVRHGDTPLVETPHSRRAVTMSDWEWADLIDNQDKLRILNDPTNAYSQNAAFAMGRRKDQIIIDAAGGTALTGETGGTGVAFDTSNAVASGVGASTGLNVEKLIEAKEILGLNDTDDEETILVHTAIQLSDMLKETEVTSSDYNTVKALVRGEINTFMGFRFVQVSQSILPVNGSSERECYFWRKSGMLLAMGVNEMGTRARITERDDKSYATQVYYAMSAGATRMEEAKVGRIECAEA